MGDETVERALVKVGEPKDVIIVDGETPEGLLRDVGFLMDRAGKNWRKVFAPDSMGTWKLAAAIRLADALKLSERDGFMAQLRQLEHSLDDNDFSFNLVTTLLTKVFDREKGGRWNLPQMDKSIRDWCVKVLDSRLTHLVGRDDVAAREDLVMIRDIITKSNPEKMAWGERETYLTEDEAEEVEESFTEEQQRIVGEEQMKRLKDLAERFDRRKGV